MIKRNPSKAKKQFKKVSNTIETLNERIFKVTLSNSQYIQLQDRLWRDFDTGTGRAG